MTPGSYLSLVDAWSRTSSRLFTSALQTNRAALAAFGVPVDRDADRIEARLRPAVDLPEWEVDLGATGDRLAVGDYVRFAKTLTDEDVERFAAATGDTNPLHLDPEWAEATRFNGRIVHGTLAAGLISAALARLPGNVIYLSQDVEFQAPVRLGDRLTADVEVVEDLGDDRYRLRTRVRRTADPGAETGGKSAASEGNDRRTEAERTIIDGEAVVLIEDHPEMRADDSE